MTIRWVSSTDDIPVTVWDDCFRAPVEGVWWYRAMERSGLEDQFTFHYGVIERNGVLIGIVPAFVMDVPLDVIAPDRLAGIVRWVGRFARFLRYQRTFFVGSPCSDEGTVGLVPGVRLDDVIESVADAVLRQSRTVGASMTVFKDFTAADAEVLAKLSGFFRVESYPGTRLSLGGSYDAYLASLRSDKRNKLRKKLRSGSQACPTRIEVVQHPSPAVLDEIFPLFWQTYLKGRTKFERLNRTFFDHAAGERTCHWLLLRSVTGGKLVAFMLCFDCRPRVVNKFIGIDYSRAGAFLYFQLWAAAVDWAAAAGFDEIQSGQTGYSAKLEIGNQLVPLVNFARHRIKLVHKVFAWQARSITWSTIDPDLAVYVKSRDGGRI